MFFLRLNVSEVSSTSMLYMASYIHV